MCGRGVSPRRCTQNPVSVNVGFDCGGESDWRGSRLQEVPMKRDAAATPRAGINRHGGLPGHGGVPVSPLALTSARLRRSRGRWRSSQDRRADSIWVNTQVLPAAIRHAAKWERLGLVEDFQGNNPKGEEEGGGGATPYGRCDLSTRPAERLLGGQTPNSVIVDREGRILRTTQPASAYLTQ